MATYSQGTYAQWAKLNAIREAVVKFEAFDIQNNNEYSTTISPGNFELVPPDEPPGTFGRRMGLFNPVDIDITDDDAVINGYTLIIDVSGSGETTGYTVTFDTPEEYPIGGKLRITQFEVDSDIKED